MKLSVPPALPCLMGAALVLCAAVNLPAAAKEIYTWTDQNGVVHYVDRPPDHPGAVSMEAPEAYRPGTSDVAYPAAAATATNEETDADQTDRTGTAEEPSLADQKRGALATQRAEQRQRRAERDAACASAQQRLDQIEPRRRVFYTDESGQTVRLDDEQRMAEVEEMKQFIRDNCD